MPFRLLVVDSDRAHLSAVERALTSSGNLVTCVSNFGDAKQRLLFAPPDLLLTAVRLGPYNGLHLVLRAHADHPEMPAIVMDKQADPVLEAEARNADAVFVTTSLDQESLVTLVNKLLAQTQVRPSPTVERRWPRKPAVVPAQSAGGEVRVVDVSYGGLRLEISGVPDDRLSRISAVHIPNVGAVPIHPIWARGGSGAAGGWWCGAEVNESDEHTNDAWRRFVDSLS